ncbi:MAG: TlpA disulfide reductase family protein [Nocardioides sp.]
MTRRRRPRVALAALAALLALTGTGCSTLSGTGDKGYISGNGEVRVLDRAARGEPVALEAETLDGEAISLADLRGRVVVVNMWWSGCVDCRKEMPELVDAAGRTAGHANFVGINIRDTSAAQGQAFARRFEVPYPSVFDPRGKALLAFDGSLNPQTIPSTVVLDAQGRVAASIIGPIPSTLTLVDLVEQLAGEQAAPEGGSSDG